MTKKFLPLILICIATIGNAQHSKFSNQVNKIGPSKFVIDTVGVSTRATIDARGGAAIWWPYPVIFIHGLGGDWRSWGELGDMFYDANYAYGGQLQYCLNADYNSYAVTVNDMVTFVPANLPAADFYDINFDCDPNGNCFSEDVDGVTNSVLSNQSAIKKQGIALGHAINAVLQATGKNKVVLMGHSMGGLCAREYLQNPSNWPDDNHHIAKLITSGTPHGGSNATSFLNVSPNIDERSEAVRDLRESYAASGYYAPFLYGGIEDDFYVQNSLLWEYYNVDVNCNGTEGNSITGLNQKPLYTDMDFAIIKSDWNWLVDGGDFVVDDYNADLTNYYTDIPDYEKFWCSDLDDNGHSNYVHTDMPEDIRTNMHALDVPDDYHLSYEIETEAYYAENITLQGIHANYSTDYDDFIVEINEPGLISVHVNYLESSWSVAVYDYLNGSYLATQQSNGNPITSILNVSVSAGQYIIEVKGSPYEGSWVQPYVFIVNFQPSMITTMDEVTDFKGQTIYPNPSSGIFHISNVKSGSPIVVMDLAGKSIMSLPSSSTIDLSALPSGNYFVQYINSSDISITEKAVLIH